MSLGAHLIELRNRIVISAIAIGIGLVAGWFFSSWVQDMLRLPIEQLVVDGRTAQVVYSDIGSGFDTKMQISFSSVCCLLLRCGSIRCGRSSLPG